MGALATPLRKQLEHAIAKARDAAEKGARQALESLAVDRHEPHGSMTPEERRLRNRLRAHGRQLGDVRDAEKGTQASKRLEREVAYEHWHRMLFARFLAENRLLIEPTHGVAITLAECEELARDRGEDPWSLAARFAQRMMPAIFRPDDPVLEVVLTPESRQELEKLLAGLPSAVFTSDDALGWTYQFWQAAEKDAVNERVKSGEKITGETLPAVTQLFTEHYMVLFLLHNTLGAWHAGRVLAARPELAQSAANEAELRRAVALPGCEWEYLRFVREPRDGHEEGKPSGPWRPAAGTFSTWPEPAADLKVLDPCCGSGHFMVAGFEILVRLRMMEEGLALEAAIRAVLAENLHGLELDPRCTQIAAFNLALAAWKWVEKPIELPSLQIACCGLGPATSETEWLELAAAAAAAGGMPTKRDLSGKKESLLSDALRSSFEALHELFQMAPELGSLIDASSLPSDMYHANFLALEPLLARMLEAVDDETRERAVTAAGMIRAARILIGPSGGYTLVVTNVPFRGRKDHNDLLKAWVDANHKEGRNDLATVFVSRMLRWVQRTGTVAAVTPQTWLVLTEYRKLRERLLEQKSWNGVAWLGHGAFETIGGHVVNVSLISISGVAPNATHEMAGIDVSAARFPDEKASLLRGESAPKHEPDACAQSCAESVLESMLDSEYAPKNEALNAEGPTEPNAATANGLARLILQSDQLTNPNARILPVPSKLCATLLDGAFVAEGTSRGDSDRFDRRFWEVDEFDGETWTPILNAPASTGCFGGRELVFKWEQGKGELVSSASVRIRGTGAWGQQSVFVARSGVPRASLSNGELHAQNSVAIVPKQCGDLPAIWEFCSSDSYKQEVSRLNSKPMAPTSALWGVPFNASKWRVLGLESYPNGLPEPQSNDPTQWLFHGHPAGMLASGPVSRSPIGVTDFVAADRHASLTCREPNPRNVFQVAVARLLGYRWPPELDEAMRLDVAARAWVTRCRNLNSLGDEDGIVCLPSVRGETSAADRLRQLLSASFADVPGGFTTARERALLAAAVGEGATAKSLDEWLREQFFEQHCALFHSRPFIWHVWDGCKDGFGALVNYHRLAAPDGEGRRVLEALASTYLGEWIERQKAEQHENREGADARLAAAQILQKELRKILDGEPPYDLFVRWKQLHEQPLGWEPDINDGVRLNIRPFLLGRDMGRRGSGLLRVRPKSIKWDKAKVDKFDRGKEPESLRPRSQFPWFWGCEPETRPGHRTNFGSPIDGSPPASKTFDGKRWNDLHYTRAAKEAARAAGQQGASA